MTVPLGNAGLSTLPSLSIAAKLYTIFPLLATATLARVNRLIYAVVTESRGIYMSSDIPTAKRYSAATQDISRNASTAAQGTKGW